MCKTFGFSHLHKKSSLRRPTHYLVTVGVATVQTVPVPPFSPPPLHTQPSSWVYSVGYQVGLLSSRRALSHRNIFTKSSQRHGNSKNIGTISHSSFKMLSIDTKQPLFTRCRTKLFISVIFHEKQFKTTYHKLQGQDLEKE